MTIANDFAVLAGNTSNIVLNSQLSANLSNYQTTAGLSANVATLTANNATNLGGVAAASYVNTSAAYTITGVHTHNANVSLTTPLIANGSSGTSGQILTSNGTSGAPYWAAAASGGVTSVATGTGLTGGTITTTGTISLVTTAGAVGTYAFLVYTAASGTSGANPGATYSGSVLQWAGINVGGPGYASVSTYYATRPSGTWQMMGSFNWDTSCGVTQPTSLMMRIA
jgi:hypothetical protein